jgi:hypothetical protein
MFGPLSFLSLLLVSSMPLITLNKLPPARRAKSRLSHPRVISSANYYQYISFLLVNPHGDLQGLGTLIRPLDLLEWIQYHHNLIQYQHYSSARLNRKRRGVLMSTDPVGDMFNMISNLCNSNFLSFGSSKGGIEANIS